MLIEDSNSSPLSHRISDKVPVVGSILNIEKKRMDPDQLSQFLNFQTNQETSRRDLQSHRDRIRDLIRQTSTCDGSKTPNVRLWIEEIGLAYDDVGQAHIIQIVTNTITGNLRFEVAHFFIRIGNQLLTGLGARPSHRIHVYNPPVWLM